MLGLIPLPLAGNLGDGLAELGIDFSKTPHLGAHAVRVSVVAFVIAERASLAIMTRSSREGAAKVLQVCLYGAFACRFEGVVRGSRCKVTRNLDD